MFLKYLSGRNYEERYWAFVLRFETLVAGVVAEGAKRLGSATDEEARAFFEQAFARCLNVDAGVVPLDWWARVELPSIDWFRAYVDAEFPSILAEVRRRAVESAATDVRSGSETDANSTPTADVDPFDRAKIRELAHKSAAFQSFLFGGVSPETFAARQNAPPAGSPDSPPPSVRPRCGCGRPDCDGEH